jgi:hypothetical protein
MKVNRTKSYGADVILYGDVYDDACNYALNLAPDSLYVSGSVASYALIHLYINEDYFAWIEDEFLVR